MNANTKPKIEIKEVWAISANPIYTLDEFTEFIQKVKDAGNEVIEEDYQNRRVKLKAGNNG